MTEEFKKQIENEARQAVTELLAQAKLKKGDVFVVGCSSSEIVGGHIGKDSSLEAAQAVYAGIAPVLAENGIWLAAQCCEHLNRAIILEREAAGKYGWEEVCVVPAPTRAAAGPPPAGSSSVTPSPSKRSVPTPESTSAAPSSGCICAGWPCRCG